MHPAVICARTMCKESLPILKGVAFSTLFVAGGLLASPFALGVLCYVGWKTGTDPTFHWTKLMGRSRENVDKIKCNVLHLIESVKRLEKDLCESDNEATSMEIDSSVDSNLGDASSCMASYRRYEDDESVSSSPTNNAKTREYPGDENTEDSKTPLPRSYIAEPFQQCDEWFHPMTSGSNPKKTM